MILLIKDRVWFGLLWTSLLAAWLWDVGELRCCLSHSFLNSQWCMDWDPCVYSYFKRHFYYSKYNSPELLYVKTNPSQLLGSVRSSSFTGYLGVVVAPAAWQSRSWWSPSVILTFGSSSCSCSREGYFFRLMKIYCWVLCKYYFNKSSINELI